MGWLWCQDHKQNFPGVHFYYAYSLQDMSLVSLQTSSNVITAYLAFLHPLKHFSLPIVANTIRRVTESNNTRKITMTDYAVARKVYGALHEEFDISERWQIITVPALPSNVIVYIKFCVTNLYKCRDIIKTDRTYHISISQLTWSNWLNSKTTYSDNLLMLFVFQLSYWLKLKHRLTNNKFGYYW